MKQVFVFLLLIISGSVFAQNGTIRGTVIEDETGLPIIAADVLVKGQPYGASTDLDGKFSINIVPGTYTVEIAYLGRQTLEITEVVVVGGNENVLGQIRLKEATNGEIMNTAVVQVKTVKNSESSLLTVKRKSASIMDGISAQKIELVGDATAVEAAKRVTGVSVEDGKYVYVRGLGDRYTKTTMNWVEIPGLDPDKNTLQMDIFPTSLIDKITVSKNFSAELPADFTGGLLNIETKDFPDKKIFTVSAGTSFNPDMHFNSDYLTYDGGNTDFLGFDDGTRALPENARSQNIPTPISGASGSEVKDFVGSFDPQLGVKRQRSLMDFSASVTIGNQLDLKKDTSMYSDNGSKLGYIFSISYKSDYKLYDDVTYGEYQRFIDPDITDLRYATVQNGSVGERGTLIGILGGLAYKNQYSKYRLSVMHLQSGESRAALLEVDNDGEAVGQSGYYARSNNLEYNERSLTNVLLNGAHVFKKSGWDVVWRLSPTISSSQDPDIRRTAFTYTAVDTSFIAGAGGNPSRIWRSLNEFSNSSKVDFTREYTIRGKETKLKTGLSHVYKQRDYEILFFDVQFFGQQNWTSTDPNDILDPENIYPGTQNKLYYQSGNPNPNPNAYASNVNNFAGYISNEFHLSKNLKSIVGLRAEKFIQKHTGRDQRYASGDVTNGRNLDNDEVLNSLDLFPSLNFIYSYTEKVNLRFTYGKTIARPSFKELSFAQILDPMTNRIFNGSLFQYADWDGDLKETRIDNVDLRWELYLKRNQMFSVSTFFKRFDSPIELVRIPEQQTSTEYQPRNVGNGMLVGFEVEAQKNFDFISPALNKFSFSGNFTFVQSKVDMTSTEYNARKTYEKTGENIKNTRQMAGQSPFVINAGVSYSDYERFVNAGIFYNVKGPTLYIVGAGLFPDIYNEPFHSLNFSINKKLGRTQRTQIDFKVANILDDRLETFYQSFKAEKQPFSSINPGRSFSFGIKHSFN